MVAPKTTPKPKKTARKELLVLTHAKELSSLVFAATLNSPAKFRFSFTSRLQNLSLEVVENIYRANDAFSEPQIRECYQRDALSSLRTFNLLVQISADTTSNMLLTKQNRENINKSALNTGNLLLAWMKAGSGKPAALKTTGQISPQGRNDTNLGQNGTAGGGQ